MKLRKKHKTCNIDKLQNYKILDKCKLKAFARYKCSLIVKNLFLGRIENIVGKEENASYEYFLYFPQYFIRVLCNVREETTQSLAITTPRDRFSFAFDYIVIRQGKNVCINFFFISTNVF